MLSPREQESSLSASNKNDINFIQGSQLVGCMAAAEVEPKECCMCGDVGLAQHLVKCLECGHRYQHTYCSRLYPNRLEESLCNWCLGRLEMEMTSVLENDSKSNTNVRELLDLGHMSESAMLDRNNKGPVLQIKKHTTAFEYLLQIADDIQSHQNLATAPTSTPGAEETFFNGKSVHMGYVSRKLKSPIAANDVGLDIEHLVKSPTAANDVELDVEYRVKNSLMQNTDEGHASSLRQAYPLVGCNMRSREDHHDHQQAVPSMPQAHGAHECDDCSVGFAASSKRMCMRPMGVSQMHTHVVGAYHHVDVHPGLFQDTKKLASTSTDRVGHQRDWAGNRQSSTTTTTSSKREQHHLMNSPSRGISRRYKLLADVMC